MPSRPPSSSPSSPAVDAPTAAVSTAAAPTAAAQPPARAVLRRPIKPTPAPAAPPKAAYGARPARPAGAGAAGSYGQAGRNGPAGAGRPGGGNGGAGPGRPRPGGSGPVAGARGAGQPRMGALRAPAASGSANATSAVPGGVRLNKRMADLGLCSRREADDWIAQGWVRVNGQVAQMGQPVVLTDRIDVDPQARGHQEQQVTIVLHKPMGYVSGQAEDGHQPAVTLINERSHWGGDMSKTRFSPRQLKGLAPAGRLDIDSVGLLVLTQDGRVARRIIGEDSPVDKEYLVRVQYGAVATDVQAAFPADQLARLRHGLSLDGQPLKPAQVDWQNPEQLRFVLTEGKKRQIRRMCELVGLKVVGLKRIRIGGVTLGQLPVGQWRYLLPHERF